MGDTVSQGWLSCLTDLSSGNYIVLASVVSVGIGIVLLRQLVRGGVCTSKARLDGKFVIITGANTGIGKETARDLAKRGARVMIACRDPIKAAAAADDVVKTSGQRLAVKTLDLSDLNSVRQFAQSVIEEEPRLDILINNAGVMTHHQIASRQGHEIQLSTNHLGHFLLTNLLLPLLKLSAPSRVVVVSSSSYRRVMACPRRVSKQGMELQFATNHLGHFLLTHLLKDMLVQSGSGRIVNVAALIYIHGKIHFDDINLEKDYNPIAAYAQSKLANILFTRELAKRLKGTGVTANCLHPGVISSDLGRHIEARVPGILLLLLQPLVALVKFLAFKTVRQGAQTTINCAVAEELEGVTGKYFSDCSETRLAAHATDDVAAQKLWDISEEMVGLKDAPDTSGNNKKMAPEEPECDQIDSVPLKTNDIFDKTKYLLDRSLSTEKTKEVKEIKEEQILNEKNEESLADSGSRQTTV